MNWQDERCSSATPWASTLYWFLYHSPSSTETNGVHALHTGPQPASPRHTPGSPARQRKRTAESIAPKEGSRTRYGVGRCARLLKAIARLHTTKKIHWWAGWLGSRSVCFGKWVDRIGGWVPWRFLGLVGGLGVSKGFRIRKHRHRYPAPTRSHQTYPTLDHRTRHSLLHPCTFARLRTFVP